jgi:hypothetical protein
MIYTARINVIDKNIHFSILTNFLLITNNNNNNNGINEFFIDKNRK